MTNPAASGATPAPADAAKSPAPTPTAGTPTPPPPRRGPGHRGQDVRDAVAEMAARAHEISLEAGSKMAAAMKDVINAAAGLTSFALESARELVQYMVRRGQMTQDEADKLMRDVEHAHGGRADSKGASAKSKVATAAPHPTLPKAEKPAKVNAKPAAPAAKPKAKSAPPKAVAKTAAKKVGKKR
jgi:polyhydroxyalkanoate synthesis regulator phasin